MNIATKINPIVDADAHVNPSHDMWADYLPADFRALAPQLEHGEECDYIVFEGTRRKLNLISAQGGREGFGEAVEGVDTFGLDEFDVAQQ